MIEHAVDSSEQLHDAVSEEQVSNAILSVLDISTVDSSSESPPGGDDSDVNTAPVSSAQAEPELVEDKTDESSY